MKRFSHLIFVLGLIICSQLPAKASCNVKDNLSMIVGTYTNGRSKGIYTFFFNQTKGIAQALDSASMPNPSYLTPSSDGRFIYSVSEMPDSTAAVYAYSFEPRNGKLHYLNRQLTLGADPCYIITNGKEIITANYTGGSMSVFPLLKNGTIAPIKGLFHGKTGGPDVIRQASPHIHCTRFSPDKKYIFATSFSADRILYFKLLPNDIMPHPTNEFTPIDPDSGPRHLIFSSNGKFAYLISELSGNVTVFTYSDGKLKKIQVATADSLHARGSADIHLSPDGKYLYASNRLKGDGIAIFKVNHTTGKIKRIGYQFTGIHPRNFNITPNGKYLLVACRDSNIIQVYRRDFATGLLSNTHHNIAVDKPVCIQFTYKKNPSCCHSKKNL